MMKSAKKLMAALIMTSVLMNAAACGNSFGASGINVVEEAPTKADGSEDLQASAENIFDGCDSVELSTYPSQTGQWLGYKVKLLKNGVEIFTFSTDTGNHYEVGGVTVDVKPGDKTEMKKTGEHAYTIYAVDADTNGQKM